MTVNFAAGDVTDFSLPSLTVTAVFCDQGTIIPIYQSVSISNPSSWATMPISSIGVAPPDGHKGPTTFPQVNIAVSNFTQGLINLNGIDLVGQTFDFGSANLFTVNNGVESTITRKLKATVGEFHFESNITDLTVGFCTTPSP